MFYRSVNDLQGYLELKIEGPGSNHEEVEVSFKRQN